MVSLEEALEKILSSTMEKESETIPLLHTLGRTVAEEMQSDSDLPSFDTSAMDGFAVKSSDIAKASEQSPVELEIIDFLPAGETPDRKVNSGTAIRIMTGAPIPDGADAVVNQEDTEWEDKSVSIRSDIKSGMNIRRKGFEIKLGDTLLNKGSIIGAKEIGMLAYVGIDQ